MEVESTEVRAARIWLSRVTRPGSAAVWSFVDAEGPVEAARALRAGRAPADVLTEVEPAQAPSGSVEQDMDTATRIGARLIIPEDDEWPAEAFASMETASASIAGAAPPLALWAKGPVRLDQALATGVAVVGARAPTPYGVQVAVGLGYDLAVANCSVIGGAAPGVEAAGHRGALLATTGRAVAIVAGGLQRVYPTTLTPQYEAVMEKGLVLSEYPPSATVARFRYVRRNRLVAGASRALVVVEASHRSSALGMARAAGQFARRALAVPGPVTSALSVGCHVLIRDGGASLATGAADVLNALDL